MISYDLLRVLPMTFGGKGTSYMLEIYCFSAVGVYAILGFLLVLWFLPP